MANNFRAIIQRHPALNYPNASEFYQIPDAQGRKLKMQHRLSKKDRWKILPDAINVWDNVFIDKIEFRVKKPLTYWDKQESK